MVGVYVLSGNESSNILGTGEVAVVVGGGGSAACVAPVITLRLPVSQNKRAKKTSVSHPKMER